MTLWLLACARPPSDAQLFGAGDCAAIVDEQVRAECLGTQGAACEDVPAGPWRSECFFVRAEERVATDPGAALLDCAAADALAGECWTHLFKELADPAHGVSLDEALAVHAGFPDPDWRPPWGWWWRRHHEAAAVIDPADCDIERDDLRRRCKAALPTALSLGWRHLVAEKPRTWCARTLDDLATDPTGDPWVRSEALDALVRAELQACP